MIGYLEYGTVVNIETGFEYEILPAMGFCVTSKRQLSEINMNEKSFETSFRFVFSLLAKSIANQFSSAECIEINVPTFD